MYDYEVFEFKRYFCIVSSTAQKIQQKSEQKDYKSQRLGRGTVKEGLLHTTGTPLQLCIAHKICARLEHRCFKCMGERLMKPYPSLKDYALLMGAGDEDSVFQWSVTNK